MIDKISVSGYKSIKKTELLLKNLNVLIGPNGAGKSNFLSIFKMVKSIINEDFQKWVIKNGGANRILHFGEKVTSQISLELCFGRDKYQADLIPARDTLLIGKDTLYYTFFSGYEYDIPSTKQAPESCIRKEALLHPNKIADKMLKKMSDWQIFHFHDTSDSSPMKRYNDIVGNDKLLSDAGNISAYLYFLKRKYPKNYFLIENTIQLIAPYFKRFVIEPTLENDNLVRLKWISHSYDYVMDIDDFSDGTLRFICYVVLLLQPSELIPETIIIDEPELGLHPKALETLVSMLKVVAENKQVIISTQSVELINYFDIEDLIVVDRLREDSNFKRLKKADFEAWLEDYSLGEMWNKNIIGGQ